MKHVHEHFHSQPHPHAFGRTTLRRHSHEHNHSSTLEASRTDLPIHAPHRHSRTEAADLRRNT